MRYYYTERSNEVIIPDFLDQKDTHTIVNNKYICMLYKYISSPLAKRTSQIMKNVQDVTIPMRNGTRSSR